MKFSTILAASSALISVVMAAPVSTETDIDDLPISVPEEALIGFIDLTGDEVSLLPVNNGTHTGILFLNTTVAEAAFADKDDLKKREADPSPWSWITLRPGQPIFKREANADANAEASPWSWITLRPGQPIFKREANADANANASPWSWITLRPGQPIFKREANAEAEADAKPSAWSWITLRPGQPIF